MAMDLAMLDFRDVQMVQMFRGPFAANTFSNGRIANSLGSESMHRWIFARDGPEDANGQQKL